MRYYPEAKIESVTSSKRFHVCADHWVGSLRVGSAEICKPSVHGPCAEGKIVRQQPAEPSVNPEVVTH